MGKGTSPLVVIHVAAGPVLNVARFSFDLVLLIVFLFLNIVYTSVCRGTPER